MSWFHCVIFSVLCSSAAALIFSRVLNKKQVHSKICLVIGAVAQAGFALLALSLTGDLDFTFLNENLLLLMVANACIAAVGWGCYARALNVKDISFSSLLFSSPIVSTILGIVLLNEAILFQKFIGIGLILAGIAVIYFKNNQLETNSLFALGAAGAYSVNATIDKLIVLQVNPLNYLSVQCLLIGLAVAIFNFRSIRAAWSEQQWKNYYFIPLSSFFHFLFNFFTTLAYTKGGDVGVVDAINNLEIFIFITVEYCCFASREAIYKKLIGASLACCGVALLKIYLS